MIGHIRGTVESRWDRGVVLDVQGVGYEIHMPESALAKLPPSSDEVTIYTHLVWKEETVSLYGFEAPEARDMFRLILEVSGVGPKLALNILSLLSPQDLLMALAQGETGRLQAIHGIGKKTAARLCVDLRDKATRLLDGQGRSTRHMTAPEPETQGTLWQDAMSALTYLGYRPPEAKDALSRARTSLGDEATLEELVRTALQGLAKLQTTKP
jgi:Holliday junction DNA helicase RuvA